MDKLLAAAVVSFGLILPAQAAPEAPLTPQERSRAIDANAAAFETDYVIREVGRAIARDLRTRCQHGDYAHVTASRELATRSA